MVRNFVRRLQPYFFSLLVHLEYLNLNRNRISFISEYAFKGLSNLRHLELENNRISTISHENLPGFVNVYLWGNALKRVEGLPGLAIGLAGTTQQECNLGLHPEKNNKGNPLTH